MLASCVLSWEIRALILGVSEPSFSHSSPSISQRCMADSVCILLCIDSWQDLRDFCFLFLVQVWYLWLGFLVKRAMPLNVILGTFFSPEVVILQEYLGQFLFQPWLIVKQMLSLNASDTFQFGSELRPIHLPFLIYSYNCATSVKSNTSVSQIKYRSLS